MFCKTCYADLRRASESKCVECGRPFDAMNPRTFLARPFPSAGQIVVQVLATTALAGVAAVAVAFHQLASSSGH